MEETEHVFGASARETSTEVGLDDVDTLFRSLLYHSSHGCLATVGCDEEEILSAPSGSYCARTSHAPC